MGLKVSQDDTGGAGDPQFCVLDWSGETLAVSRAFDQNATRLVVKTLETSMISVGKTQLEGVCINSPNLIILTWLFTLLYTFCSLSCS